MESTAPLAPTLVIDGSSSEVFAGFIGTNQKWLCYSQEKGSPLECLFPAVEKLFQSTNSELADLKSYAYCEGPGSVLGLRLCAMAIQTWSHLHRKSACWYTYNSLQLTAALICMDTPDIQHALLVSNWKKDAWHAVIVDKGKPEPVIVIQDSVVQNWSHGPLFYLPQRKNWQTIPKNATILEYSPQRLTDVLHVLRHTKNLELYTSGMNAFRKWTPERHRAAKPQPTSNIEHRIQGTDR